MAVINISKLEAKTDIYCHKIGTKKGGSLTTTPFSILLKLLPSYVHSS